MAVIREQCRKVALLRRFDSESAAGTVEGKLLLRLLTTLTVAAAGSCGMVLAGGAGYEAAGAEAAEAVATLC